MSHNTIFWLSIVLGILILLSAFFSGSETSMMSINRYRLRHLARKKNRAALRVSRLLKRTDRLLSVILIGNTFANLFASSLTTMIAYQIGGDIGTVVGVFLLSVVILVFAEITPKSLATIFPQQFAFIVSLPLKWLLYLFYPLVWVTSHMANGILRLFGVKKKRDEIEALSGEELRTVVTEAGDKIEASHQDMLVRILDLEKMTVEDVMIPRHKIKGIELEQSWERVIAQITSSRHTRLPIYQDEIDNVQGWVDIRKAVPLLAVNQLTPEKLLGLADEIYFIPEGTSLTTQLLNFRRERKRFGLVVDEYGDIHGLVTIEDIIEEIVGELASEEPSVSKLVTANSNGSYLVSGQANIRELNRLLEWALPVDGPKTLSGVIIEHLESMPVEHTCLKLGGYPIEITKVDDNLVIEAIIWPSR